MTLLSGAPPVLAARHAEEQNHMAVRRLIEEVWNRGELRVADEIFTVGCVPHTLNHDAADIGDRRGPKHIKLIVAAWRAAFPDWRIEIESLLAEGDRVALLSTGYGTHK